MPKGREAITHNCTSARRGGQGGDRLIRGGQLGAKKTIYIYIYIYICMCVCVYVWERAGEKKHNIYIYIYMYVCMYVCMCVCVTPVKGGRIKRTNCCSCTDMSISVLTKLFVPFHPQSSKNI